MESERMQHSLSAQVSYYSALIQKNPEWKYAGVFADYGISGTGTQKRDEFNHMLAECEAGNIDIILTKSIQRFARNTVDLLNTVRHLKELGIEVRFEKEKINSLSGDGELMLSILASFAQEETAAFRRTSSGVRSSDSSRAFLTASSVFSDMSGKTISWSSYRRKLRSSAGCMQST
jgi:site-specific DNA recombinase